MRNFFYGLMVGMVLTFFITVANAQTTYYSNQYGQPLGSATQSGNTTYYSNQYGQPLGSATQSGNTTYYSNQYGQPQGSANTYGSPSNQPQPTWNPYIGGTRK
jgi:hypothetical protein